MNTGTFSIVQNEYNSVNTFRIETPLGGRGSITTAPLPDTFLCIFLRTELQLSAQNEYNSLSLFSSSIFS